MSAIIKLLIDALAYFISQLQLFSGSLNIYGKVSIFVILSLIATAIPIIRTRTAKRQELEAEYDGVPVAECPATPAHQRQAHDALRKEFGRKRFVSLEQYRALAAKNPNCITAILDEKGNMVGYFDVFPLTNEFGSKFVKCHTTEVDMTPDDQLEPLLSGNSDYIYLGAIFNFESKNLSKRNEITRFLRKELLLHLLCHYPARENRKYIALASSTPGSNILKSYKFSLVSGREERADKSDLYILEFNKIPDAMKKVRTYFGNVDADLAAYKLSQKKERGKSKVSEAKASAKNEIQDSRSAKSGKRGKK